MKLKEILNNIIYEGRHDKNTFKAIFLSGLPASGKTEFYNFALKHLDFKHLDADKILAYLVKKNDDNLKDTSIYNKHSEEINNKLKLQSSLWTERGLGVVIDTTGQNVNKILNIKNQLEEKNYQTAMVFIEKTVEESLKYAKTRERSVDHEYIIKVKEKLDNNKNIYSNVFNTFIKVKGRDEIEYTKAEKKIKAWLRR